MSTANASQNPAPVGVGDDLINPAPAGAGTHAVGVKLPEFWDKTPQAWFRQAEAAFRRSRITEQLTMFDYTVMKLSQETMVAVGDALDAAEESDTPYDVLKERLLATYQKTPLESLYELLDFPSMPDQRPTITLNNMLALLPAGEKPTLLFQAMFLRRMPSYVHDQLAHRKFETVQQLAAEADKIFSGRRPDAV